MKVDWNKTFVDIEGKDVLADKENKLTLGKMAITGLCQMVQGDQDVNGAEKFKMGELANKVAHEPDSEFEVEDIAKIKNRIGVLYGPFLVFQAFNALK